MREHKKIANYLPTGAVLFFAIIIMAFALMPAQKKKFELNQKESLAAITTQLQVIQPEKIKEILASNDQNYQFIDLRSSQEFDLYHLSGAINIHIHDILKSENEALLNPTDKINILYGATVEDACPVWVILKQLNYKNNSIMLGGFKLVKSNVIDKYAPEEVWFRNEVAQYDYAEIVKETAGAGSVSGSSTATRKAPIIKRKKKKGVAGGC